MSIKPKYIYALATALISILFGVMFAIVPFGADDLWYLENSTGEFGSWERFITTFQNCLDHTNWDTGRFANLISAPFLSVIPQWISGIVSGFAVWVIFMAGPAITRCGWVSICSAAWVAAFTFAFPWLNYLFLLVYVSNYVWALALGLVFLYIFFRKPELHGFKLVLACILAYFVGWWHEGQSVPLFMGLVVYLICWGRRPERKEILLLAFLGLGILTLVSMPAIWSRTLENRHVILTGSWRNVVYTIVMSGKFFFLLCGVLCLIFARSKYRKRFFENRKLASVICGLIVLDIVSAVIVYRYYNGPRTSAFMETFSLLGLMAIARYYWTSRKWMKYGALTLVTIAALINLGVSIPIQLKLTHEYEVGVVLAEQAKKEGKAYVFCDFTPLSLGIDLYKPSYLLLTTYWGLRGCYVVPKVYEDFSLVNSVYEECSTPGLMIYKNNLVSYGFIPSKYAVAEVETDDGRVKTGRVNVYWFVTEEDDTCHAVVPLFLSKEDRIINARLKD